MSHILGSSKRASGSGADAVQQIDTYYGLEEK